MDSKNQEKDINVNKEEHFKKLIPIINKKENNLEIILMEKDKEIINISEKNAQLNSTIENISNELKNKNLEISTLKSDISTLNNEKKLFEEEIKKNLDEITKLNDIIKEKEKIIEEFNSNKEINNKKYLSLLEEQKNETNQMAEKNLKMQNEIYELNSKLVKKNRDIINLENIICKSREKDNQILILKKDLIEKEKILKEFQNKLIIANNDLRTSQNFNEERMKQFYSQNNKDKKSDIISFVINKIQNIILFLDSKDNFENQNMKIEENIVEIKENYVLFDLLEQNISMLKSKIMNKYNFILNQNKENKNKIRIYKNKNEELILTLQKIKNNYDEKLNDLSQKINQLGQNLRTKEEEVKNIKLELKSKSLSKNIFNNFYSKIVTKLDKEYLKEINIGENKSEEKNETKMSIILNIIDFLIEKINNLNKFVKEYDVYKIKVNDIINQKLNKSNEQIDEVKELRNNIQELNELLNQSNIYLNNSRKENKQLKKRILNLEKSINMISRNNLSKNNESKYLLTYNNDNNRNLNIFLED